MIDKTLIYTETLTSFYVYFFFSEHKTKLIEYKT